MAGGGDIGGIGGGGGGGGGGKGGSPGDVGGGSPDMTGLGSGGSDFGGGGGMPDFGNAWDAGTGGTGDTGGAGGNFGNALTSDPNVGAPQSQNPNPSVSPASIGGTPSGTSQQGFGGGSQTQTQDQSGQLGQALQQAVQLLKQPPASPSLNQLAGQGFGGGSPTQVPTLGASSIPQAGQGFGGGNLTQATSEPTPSSIEPSSSPQEGQGFGGGSPSQEATSATGPSATPVPTTSVPASQVSEQPIPGSQPAVSPQLMPLGRPMPDSTINIGQGFGGGQTGGAAQPGEEASQGIGELPRDENAPAPDFSPKTTDTTPAADTGAATPAASPPTGPTTSRGQPAGTAPAGAGVQNPMKIIPDIIQALMGNPGPLLHDLSGQQGAQPQYPYAPTTGNQRGPSYSAPETGGEDLNKKPGGPDNPHVDPNDVQGQRRQQWYQTHDRTDPFPEDTYVPQGPTQQGGTLAQQGAGQPVNWHQIATMPASTHAQNFNQPFNQNLVRERAQFFDYADRNPAFKQQLFQIMGNEQGSHPQGTQGTLESLTNRVNSEHLNFHAPRATGWYQRGGYYDHGGGRGDPRVLEQSYQNVKRGSNITNYATDNASNAATRNARGGLARREVQTGRFRNQSQYGGEWFQSPGREGNRPAYEEWRSRMEGGAAPQAPQPTRPTPAPVVPSSPRASVTPPPDQNMASMYGLDWV